MMRDWNTYLPWERGCKASKGEGRKLTERRGCGRRRRKRYMRTIEKP